MKKLLLPILMLMLCFSAYAQFITTEEDKDFNEQLELYDSTIRSVNVPMMYPRVTYDNAKEDYFSQVSWIRKKTDNFETIGVTTKK